MNAAFCWIALVAAAPALDSATRAKIDVAVRAELEAKGVPSASLAVVVDGKIAYLQGYGQAQLSPKRPAAPSMRYAIGSISKEFLATAMLMLEAEGRLSLDDKLGKHLPGLGAAGEATLRQLLSHTAGVRDYWPQDYVMEEMLHPITHEALIARWGRQPLDFAPGERWQYSNTGYYLAGAVLEKITGDTVFGFLQKRIFTPLKMTSVVDVDQGRLAPADATGYTVYGLGTPKEAPKEAPGWLFACGELAMTAEDLARWDISIIDRSLITPAAYHELETDTLLNSGAGTQYGLGLFVKLRAERRVLAHDGEVSGFIADNKIVPDSRAAVVVLTNADFADAAGSAADKVQELLLASSTPQDAAKLDQAKGIFEGLRHGKLDRSLLTPNCNAYFSESAIAETAHRLASFGKVQSFDLTHFETRGGMDERDYKAVLAKKTLTIVTRVLPDGKVEQLTLAQE
jgi:CubicO group peptidase (beta-lactamase class C family)